MPLFKNYSSLTLATMHTVTERKWYQSYLLNPDTSYGSKPPLGKSLDPKHWK